MSCRVCGADVNNRGFCYYNHYNADQVQIGTVEVEEPASFKVTTKRVDWFKERLQVHPSNAPKFPCKVRETARGVIFYWDDVWQHRLDDPKNPSVRWITSGKKKVFPALTDSKSLVFVEGIFDALALYRHRISSVALLTTLPRLVELDEIKETLDDYDHFYWMPDGDVDVNYIMRGLDTLKLIFPNVKHLSLPYTDDPCSLPKEILQEIIDNNIK